MTKGFLAVALATSLTLSAPMSVFAAPTTMQDSQGELTWQAFVEEVAGLLSSGSKTEIAKEINKLNSKSETSEFETLYNALNKAAPNVAEELEAKSGLNLTQIKDIVSKILDDKTVESTDLESDNIVRVLNNNKQEIIDKLNEKNISVAKVKELLEQVEEAKELLKVGEFGFLADETDEFVLKDTDKLDFLLIQANKKLKLKNSEITETIVKDILVILNKAEGDLKADMLKAAKDYGLMVKTVVPPVIPPVDPPVDPPVTPPTDNDNTGGGTTGGTGGGGGGGGSTSQQAQKDITGSLDKLTQKDADVKTATKEILKDVQKLDAAGAKAVAGPVIKNMTDVIKKAETPAQVKEAQKAMVTLVEALVSRVTVQEVAVKDGKATLSASKVKAQIKDAEDMIKELAKETEKSQIQLSQKVKVTLNFELDKEVADVAVEIPEGLWKAIDKKANVAITAKGVKLVLEQNTFAEETYTMNIKEKDGVVELTTSGTFKQPIAVTFDVGAKIKNYPTAVQVLEEGNKVVGGVYDPETGTVTASLKHFSFYTVEESTPKAFKDISGLTWEKKAVNELSARGYIAGMTEDKFAPHANTTRAEFAAMLTRVIPTAEIEAKLNFTDLKADAWYYTSVATAVNQGWLVGKDNNKFDPSAPVTREEVAAVLSRILEQKGYLQTADAAEGVNVSAWAKDSVRLYLREVETVEITELDMAEAATRAELVTMIYELIQK